MFEVEEEYYPHQCLALMGVDLLVGVVEGVDLLVVVVGVVEDIVGEGKLLEGDNLLEAIVEEELWVLKLQLVHRMNH